MKRSAFYNKPGKKVEIYDEGFTFGSAEEPKGKEEGILKISSPSECRFENCVFIALVLCHTK